MTTPTQDLDALNEVRIVAYVLFGSTLPIYIVILVKMLSSKDWRHQIPLIIVSLLMILNLVSAIVFYQLEYTAAEKYFNGDHSHLELVRQIILAC